ncbi:MAG TPA: hypothetical protein VJ921_06550, partial [Vicinamibacteria bacterium]|nr:hypothetical protein [Vicinamibacteria bacterium]
MKALLLAVFLSQEEAATDVAAARERERVARLSLEAAKSKEFTFVADVASRTLSLRLGGVALAAYKVDSIDLGVPLASSAAPVALEDLYSCVAPPREPVEIVPGPPPAPVAPGSEEEKKPPVPRSAILSCEPPLALHLVSASKVLGLRERLRLFGDRKDEPRVRLVVSEEDADRL